MGKTFRDKKRAGAKAIASLRRQRGKGSLGQGKLVMVECSTEGCFEIEMMPDDMEKVTCWRCVQKLVKGGVRVCT